MKEIVLVLCCLPFVLYSQERVVKYFDNGNIKYEGQFKNDSPDGIFKYYYVCEFLIHQISSDFEKETLTVVSIFLVFIISYLLIYQIAKFVKYKLW